MTDASILFGLILAAGPENCSKHDRRKYDDAACQHAAVLQGLKRLFVGLGGIDLQHLPLAVGHVTLLTLLPSRLLGTEILFEILLDSSSIAASKLKLRSPLLDSDSDGGLDLGDAELGSK